MTLTINGTDITGYIAKGGVKWQRNDIDGPNTGRVLNGTLQRDRVATKDRLDVTCRPLTSIELYALMQLISSEWVTVVYTSPTEGGEATKTMYSNNIPATYLMEHANGTEYWGGVTFPLIEK